jgi:hypothetical protein
MKKRLIHFLLSMFLLISVNSIFAQDPPPPPGGGHGQNTNQTPGGSAPIGNGLFILSALAAAYGSYKVYRWKFQSSKKDEQ